MFRTGVTVAMLGAAVLAPSAGGAECQLSSDAGAVQRPLSPQNEKDAATIISMATTPKLLKTSYDSVISSRPSCEIEDFTANGVAYQLRGDDAKSRARVALPAKKGEPAALMMPVVDMTSLTKTSSQSVSAQVSGYMLAVVTPQALSAWRYYTAMPEPAVIQRDMTEVLSGRAQPIFQTEWATGKTSLFVGQ